jgi:hypothetical protein
VHSLSSGVLPALGSATDAEGVNKYLCGTVSGISFAVAFFCILAGGSW